MVRIAGLSSGDSSPGDEEPGGRTVEPSLIGGWRGRQASPKDVDELSTTGKSRTTHRPSRPREMSTEQRSTEKDPSNQKSTHTKKRKRRYGSYMAESEAGSMLSRVITALAASVDSGDSFTQLAAEEIYKRQSLVPTPEHLAKADYEPSHRKYMLQCDKHEAWMQGEREELTSIEKNGVWTRDQPPYGTKVIPLKWVYKVKKDRLGAIQRYKCRLVAQGFFQVFGQDYTDTYSPVAKFTSIRTLLAITAQLGLKVHQMDVDTAFLNAPIYEDIWVKVPDGTPIAPGDNGVYKLRKALYGLKQAPREWNYHVDKFLVTKLGFRRLEADPCIYKKTVIQEVKGVKKEQHALIALYVDDLLIACSNKQMCKDLEKEFSAEFSMKMMGSVNHILGMDVRNSVENHTVHLSKHNPLLMYIIIFNNMEYTVMAHQ